MKLIQIIKILWFRFILSNIKIKGKVKIKIPTLFLGKGQIKLGNRVHFGYFPSPYFYNGYNHIEARMNDAYISIGDNTHINNNCSIIANSGKITIGKNCVIGTNLSLFNSDFHGVKISERNDPEKIISQDIEIGDNVFIGNNVTILKNVKIGCGSIIGAGSVVTKSFPEDSVIGGNPAKLIKRIENNEQTSYICINSCIQS